MNKFGEYVKNIREAKKAEDPSFSLRKIAQKAGMSPTFLSRMESGSDSSLPSDEKIVKLAEAIGEDPDVLLAVAGRVSRRLQDVITKRPQLFRELILQLKDAPDHAILRVVREVRDGKW